MKREEKYRIEKREYFRLEKEIEDYHNELSILAQIDNKLYYEIYNSDKEKFDSDFYSFLDTLDNNKEYRELNSKEDKIIKSMAEKKIELKIIKDRIKRRIKRR